MAKFIIELDYYEDKEAIEVHMNAHKYYSALFEIYNLCRSELKHGQEELSQHIDGLLERIKEEAGIVLND